MKIKYFSIILIIAMICNFFIPFTAFANESTNRTFEYANFTVNYNIVNSWDNNQNIEIKITNTGSEVIRNWAVQYDPCGTITGLWGGELLGTNAVKNAYYNSDIDVGAYATFGYTLTNVSGTPNEFVLCPSYREARTDGFTVDFSVQNSWDAGFSGLITITNTTDTPIMAWELSFYTNFSIIQTENFNIIERNNNSYKISGTYNGNIPAFSSVQMNLIGSYTETPEISNEQLTELKISNTSSGSQPQGEIYFKDIESDNEVAYDENNGVFFVRNQILLTAKDDVSFEDVSSLINSYNAKIVGFIKLTNDFQIEFNNEVTVDYLYQLIDELKLSSLFEFASLNTAFTLSADDDTIIDDPKSMVNLDTKTITNSNWNIYAINADEAWKNYYSQMTSVKIGLFDTMFDKGHDDLNFVQPPWENPNIETYTSNVKDQHHGTQVAGVMAATYNNGIGITGICPKNELYAYSYVGGTTTFTNIMSYKYGFALLVANNVRVINCSMGYEYGTSYAATINATVLPTKNNPNPSKTVISAISENSNIFDKFLTKLINNGYDFVIINSEGNGNGKYYIYDSSCTATYG